MAYQVDIRPVSCGGQIVYKAFVYTKKGCKSFGGYRGQTMEELTKDLALAGYTI